MVIGGKRGPAIDTCFEIREPLRKYWPHSREGTRRCLPHFMLFGLGHSGSSTLSQLLQVHPDIHWNVKWHPKSWSHEVRYWQRRRNKKRTKAGWGYFFDILPPGSQIRLGGKSPGVSIDGGKKVAEKIVRMAPWLKIVMFMREPLEWTTSEFYLSPSQVRKWATNFTNGLKSSTQGWRVTGHSQINGLYLRSDVKAP